MKKRLLILVFVVLLCGLAYIFMNRDETEVLSGSFNKVAVNLQQPKLIGEDIFFFTGTSFAKFNTTNGQTTRISNYFNTQGQITVGSWSDNSVLFYTSGTSSDDVFGRASQDTKNITSNRWWRYDFSQNQLQLMDFPGAGGCSSTVEASKKIYCFSPIKGSSYNFDLVSYDTVSHEYKKLIAVNSAVITASLWGEKLLYVTQAVDGSQSLKSYSLSDGGQQIVYHSDGQIQYDNNNDSVMINERPLVSASESDQSDTESSGTKLTKSTLKVLDYTGKILASKNINEPGGQIMGSSGSLVYSTLAGDFYAVVQNDIKSFKIPTRSLGTVWQLNGTNYFLRSDNRLYSDGGSAPTKRSADTFKESLNTTPNTFYISNQNSDISNLHFNAKGRSFTDSAPDVDKFLISNGYDPDQFSFNWIVVNAADVGSEASNVLVLK